MGDTTIKIPTFCLEEAEAWFSHCEAFFETQNIVESRKKFIYAIMGLPSILVDTVLNANAFITDYRRLKWAVLRHLGKGVKQEPAEETEVIDLSKQEPAEEIEVIEISSDEEEEAKGSNQPGSSGGISINIRITTINVENRGGRATSDRRRGGNGKSTSRIRVEHGRRAAHGEANNVASGSRSGLTDSVASMNPRGQRGATHVASGSRMERGGRDSSTANRNRNIKGRGGAARVASGIHRGRGGKGGLIIF